MYERVLYRLLQQHLVDHELQLIVSFVGLLGHALEDVHNDVQMAMHAVHARSGHGNTACVYHISFHPFTVLGHCICVHNAHPYNAEA